MTSLRMEGPYNLDTWTIDAKVTYTSPGNYVLGRQDERGVFLIKFIGRSDSNLRTTLKSWIGQTKRPLFKFCYAHSAKAAFEKECENYHDFNPPDNDDHPHRPEGSNWTCPRCDIFGIGGEK